MNTHLDNAMREIREGIYASYPRAAGDMPEKVARDALDHDEGRACVCSTPGGLAVYDGAGKHVETFPYGKSDDAWALARELDEKAGFRRVER